MQHQIPQCSSDYGSTYDIKVARSRYCRQEMLWAIEYKKPIQLVLEADPRFGDFDVDRWRAGAVGQRHR
jgi:hypothetical protein